MPTHLDLWKPTPIAVIAAIAGIVVGGLGVVLAIAIGLDPPEGSRAAGTALLGLAFFAFTPVIVGFFVASLTSRRSFARAAAMLLCAATTGVAGVFLGAGVGSGVGEAVMSGGMCCALPTGVLSLVGVGMLVQGFRNGRRELRELVAERLADAVRGKRVVTFDTLVDETGVAEDEIVDLLWQVTRVWSIPGKVVPEARCFIDTSEDVSGREKVLGVVSARGRAEVQEIARELAVPPGLVKHWLYLQAAAGRFHGAIHEDTIFSDAAMRAKGGACPDCGSPLPAGVGGRRCTYCGTEIFAVE